MLVDSPLARNPTRSSVVNDRAWWLLRIVYSLHSALRFRRVKCIYSDRTLAYAYWFRRRRSAIIDNHPSTKTSPHQLTKRESSAMYLPRLTAGRWSLIVRFPYPNPRLLAILKEKKSRSERSDGRQLPWLLDLRVAWSTSRSAAYKTIVSVGCWT